MTSVNLKEPTYRLLAQRANETSRSPDELADEVLQRELAPSHPYVETVPMAGGPTAVIKGSRIPVSILVGYVEMGETPQSIVENVLPRLTLAQVHDALSYYYDHRADIDRERAANTEEAAQARLRERLGDEAYGRLTRTS